MIVTTENGSKYRVDLDAKTWERLSHPKWSNQVRTKMGAYDEIRLSVGSPMEMLCPPITPGTDGRFISTSDVVSIEEES